MSDKHKTIGASTHPPLHAPLILPVAMEFLLHLCLTNMTSAHLRLAPPPPFFRRRHGRSVEDGHEEKDEQQDAHTHHELHILFTMDSNGLVVRRERRACV